ncbi:MAG TPA: hypothetical protein VF075_11850 [Pyrinomonadaceae bacterium]
MSSEKQIPPSGRFYVSAEECREMFGDFASSPWLIDIPDHHKEMLEERIADYCKNGVEMTPWEEFEKELFETLMEG